MGSAIRTRQGNERAIPFWRGHINNRIWKNTRAQQADQGNSGVGSEWSSKIQGKTWKACDVSQMLGNKTRVIIVVE